MHEAAVPAAHRVIGRGNCNPASAHGASGENERKSRSLSGLRKIEAEYSRIVADLSD